MVEGFDIISHNNQNFLYIYLDINTEFARNITNKKNIKSFIKDFVINNKIAFIGTVVVIAGGLVISNYYLNNNKIYDINNPIMATTLLLNEEDDMNSLIESPENIETNNNIDNSSKEINDEASEIRVEKSNIVSNKKDTNNVTNIQHQDTKTIVSIPEENNQNESTTQVETVDNNIYVTIKRSSGQIVTLELEEYVTGVVAAEMPAEFNEEALKAQAIIARTYTLKALQRGQILGDTEATQSYKDQNQLKTLWGSKYSIYYAKIQKCVNSTKGITLKYQGNYIEAVYHSTSNGMTEEAFNVWGNSFPYLISVDSPYDTFNKSFFMEKLLSYSEISSKLGIDIDEETEFIILEKTESGRVKNIEVGNQIFNGVNFRNRLGLRSTDFEITKTEQGIIFKTKGYGHGVGMSQYGANGMASAGYNYEQILLHYYPGVTLSY